MLVRWRKIGSANAPRGPPRVLPLYVLRPCLLQALPAAGPAGVAIAAAPGRDVDDRYDAVAAEHPRSQLVWGVFGVGITTVVASTFLIDHLALFGLRQPWQNL